MQGKTSITCIILSRLNMRCGLVYAMRSNGPHYKCPTTLQELADAAEKIINEKFAYDPRSTYTYRKDSEEISVELDQVIIAMLAYAEECGGEGGKRYVACAIMACSQGRRRGWSACGPRHNMAHPFFIHLSVILSYTKKSGIFLS